MDAINHPIKKEKHICGEIKVKNLKKKKKVKDLYFCRPHSAQHSTWHVGNTHHNSIKYHLIKRNIQHKSQRPNMYLYIEG